MLTLEIFFAGLILGLIVFVFTNEFFQQRTGVSPMPTVPVVRRALLSHIPADFEGKLVELGSGWGGIAFKAARMYPKAQIIGVEYSPFPYAFARAKLFLRNTFGRGQKNLRLVRGDFFEMPMWHTDVVICYLSNGHMKQLEPKLRKELPQGAMVISSTFHMPHWQPESVQDLSGMWDTKIFVYRQGVPVEDTD